MMTKIRYFLLLIMATSLLTTCAGPTIGEMNCQASDVDAEPPFVLLTEDTVASANAPFAEQMTNYHRAALAEYQLTYTDVLCTIRVYEDADTAVFALQQLCLAGTGEETAADYGQESCGFQTGGIVNAHFRQGAAVVTIREDGGGSHVGEWAEAVNGRLME